MSSIDFGIHTKRNVGNEIQKALTWRTIIAAKSPTVEHRRSFINATVVVVIVIVIASAIKVIVIVIVIAVFGVWTHDDDN